MHNNNREDWPARRQNNPGNNGNSNQRQPINVTVQQPRNNSNGSDFMSQLMQAQMMQQMMSQSQPDGGSTNNMNPMLMMSLMSAGNNNNSSSMESMMRLQMLQSIMNQPRPPTSTTITTAPPTQQPAQPSTTEAMARIEQLLSTSISTASTQFTSLGTQLQQQEERITALTQFYDARFTLIRPGPK